MITLLAKVELYAKGIGRNIPVASGYRPLFNFKGASTKTSGSIELIDVQNLLPGTSGIVKITFVTGIIDNNFFKPGVKFMFDEGRVATGEGEFLEILDQRPN